MTDVQSQLEANGLPTKFASTADTSTDDHTAVNAAATISNADVKPATGLKPPAPAPAPLEQSSLLEPVTLKEPSVIPESSPIEENTKVETNGSHVSEETNAAAIAPSHINGHDAPQSSIVTSEPTSSEALPTQASTESMVPSSMPAELTQQTTATESESKTVLPALDQIVTADQAPTSDLRTVPHSDQLAPEAVASIEERKHEEDNNAPFSSTAPMLDQPAVSDVPAPLPASESESNKNTGLLSPPAQSPPPAPEISHATLPLTETGVATPTNPPVEPAPTPAVPVTATDDTVMEDAPLSVPSEVIPPVSVAADAAAPKAVREREDDADQEEPSAKRLKTEDLQTYEEKEFKIPEAPAFSATTESLSGVHVDGDDIVTAPRLAHMKKVISNLKKSNASQHFRLPVDYVALNIPTYPNVVTRPMDLGTIDSKLKKNEYSSIRVFIQEFEQIVRNCELFNGKEHTVTQMAHKMQSSFNNQMHQLPKVSEVEPSKAEKKAMKLKTESVRAAPPRRQSVTTPVSAIAKSPKSAAPVTPSFAPNPDGVPLIRRDSSIVDGRPKRAIVPTKRNSDFSGVRPKKKKYELQLRFCHEVLKEISSPKHWQLNQYFTHPVDPVALNIPTYFQVIKKPMDLGTVAEKLNTNQYEKAKDFEEDVRLVFKNCYKFNPDGDYVNQMGHQLEELFDRKWAQKDDWIAAREPHSEPSEAEEEDEEEASEEEDADSEDDRNEKIKALQAQIAAMSKQMGELTQPKAAKKKKSTPPATKTKKAKSKKEKAPQFPGLNKPKETKKKGSKPKADKDRYVTFQEKQYISNGIGMLPEKQMQEALRIIQNSVPSLANNGDGEIELDIEEVPNHALLKLLSFVKKYAPPPPEELEAKAEAYSAGPAKSKKNKPMSKSEQEAQIEELKGRLGAYAGPISPETMQSVETGNDSSDDSADSEESEEE